MNDNPAKPSENQTLLEAARRLVTDEYGDELWTAIKTGLGVIGSLSLKGRAHPVSLIFEGASGRGKSTVINILSPDRDEMKKILFRLDKFTPKSFVTHSATVPKGEIGSIDLLPQIKDKVLLTKELAPLFRGRDQDLTENFATLTAILDGKGHKTHSGVHGTRGYDGQYVFNWLGATTPIPTRTDAIMAQLGNRLLRYEIVGQDQSEDELVEFAQSYIPETTEARCQSAVNKFLSGHFAKYPIRTVEPNILEISEDQFRELVRFAKLIAQGRVEVSREGESEELIPGTAEGPHRVILYLRTILAGLALIHGRGKPTKEDLAVIRHIAFSSLPCHRRKVLRAGLVSGGLITSKKIEEVLGVSRPTARDWMRELAATDIVSLTDGKGTRPDCITLAGEWTWLLPMRNDEDEDYTYEASSDYTYEEDDDEAVAMPV